MSNPSVTRALCEAMTQDDDSYSFGDVRRRARAYLALLDSREWQDIETAPKDRRVDLWVTSPDRVEQWRETNCWWSADYKLWMNLRGRWDLATHWMLLPDPPEAK